jgi:hypothetical protein
MRIAQIPQVIHTAREVSMAIVAASDRVSNEKAPKTKEKNIPAQAQTIRTVRI